MTDQTIHPFNLEFMYHYSKLIIEYLDKINDPDTCARSRIAYVSFIVNMEQEMNEYGYTFEYGLKNTNPKHIVLTREDVDNHVVDFTRFRIPS